MSDTTLHGAEYAVRWDPAQGGPTELAAVAEALGLNPRKTQQARVGFLHLVQPTGLPSGYRLIGRERILVKGGQETPEVMLKLRGPDPWPAAVAHWPPRLAHRAELKFEVDVSWLGHAPKRALSMSLTVDGALAVQVLPASWVVQTPPAYSQMVRHRLDNDVTAEHWQLPDGRSVFEVSMGGTDDDPSLARFVSQVVQRLNGIQPLPGGMTDLAGDG
ncbi:hypothetical protein KAK07_06450 [Ideonella sp. 4Y16]|uniref:hypothetical protein n=1 Tax=Ideonella alba TaxID=2824118 RepID=UPI001B392392|nr:hypothetical protein [Ideonella alba]MBQ0942969.1 hypothetical protein [Ideonella alba]